MNGFISRVIFLLVMSFAFYSVHADSTEQQLKGIDRSIRLREYKQAIKQLKPLVLKQNVDALYRMAGLYRLGKGADKSLDKAMQLYRQAAERGYADAQFALASILEKRGRLSEAENWYQKAADQGQGNAQKKLKILQQSKKSQIAETVSDEQVFSSIVHNDIDKIKSLIDEGYDFAILDGNLRTPLMTALLAKQEDMSGLLLTVSQQTNHADSQGNRAIHLAVANSYDEIVRQLINLNVDLNVQDQLGNTPLMIAVRHDDAEISKLLLQHRADPRIQNRKKNTVLDIARTRNHQKTLNVLAQFKLDTTARPAAYSNVDLASFRETVNRSGSIYRGWPILNIASLLGENIIVKQLIRKGAKVNELDSEGNTALHRAASKGQNDTVKLLLDSGANINARNMQSETPLYFCAEAGYPKTVKLLLDAGADTSILSSTGNSPLKAAISAKHIQVAALLAERKLGQKALHNALIDSVHSGMEEISIKLIKRDKNIHLLDKNQRSLLWHSANLGQTRVVEALLKRSNSQLNKRDINGYAPLARAVLNGHYKIVQLLVQKGADLNSRTKENNTLLMQSILSGSIETSKFLLGRGVEVDARNNAGNTALIMAAGAGNNTMVELLIQHGANIQQRNNDDQNAYQVAVNAGHAKTAEIIKNNSGKLFKLFN
jgi:ankyrin repeat protein